MSHNNPVARFVDTLDGFHVDMPLDIVEFHKKFGLFYDGPPRLLPPDLQQFRDVTHHEELKEYEEAVAEGDLNKAADALADGIYFLLGTALLHGIPFAEVWNRVQNANMSKIRCEREDDSKRGSTFDVIKPEGWTAPDHSDLVDRSNIDCRTCDFCSMDMDELYCNHQTSMSARPFGLSINAARRDNKPCGPQAKLFESREK